MVFVYSSNALEGNTLNENEVYTIVEKGLTIGGKTIKEHIETVNLASAFDYIWQRASDPFYKMTLQDLSTVHGLIVRDIDGPKAHLFRKKEIRITGVNYSFPDPVKIPDLMEEFIAWLHAAKGDPIIKAADAHLKLLSIHPFSDGNGATARLLMNFLLLQAGCPPAIILPEKKDTYFHRLAQAQTTGDPASYYEFIRSSIC